jgi:hypothetical protein
MSFRFAPIAAGGDIITGGAGDAIAGIAESSKHKTLTPPQLALFHDGDRLGLRGFFVRVALDWRLPSVLNFLDSASRDCLIIAIRKRLVEKGSEDYCTCNLGGDFERPRRNDNPAGRSCDNDQQTRELSSGQKGWSEQTDLSRHDEP